MLAFDVETTGLLKPEATELHLQPFITEIYVAKFDQSFKIIDEFESFVKPPVPIPDEVIKITGITNEMVSDSPSFLGIYEDLCGFFLGEEKIFAHNASFDLSMLANELKRYDLLLKFPWCFAPVCTVEASMPLNNKRLPLGELHKIATGTELLKAHRAKNDVLGLVRCVEWLSGKGLV